MARFEQEVFDIKQPLFIRKPFTGNGRHFVRGMKFDWRKLAVSAHRVRQLFRSKHLTHVEPAKVLEMPEIDTSVKDKKVEAEKAVKKPLEIPQKKEEKEEVEKKVYQIDHKAGPYYNVIDQSGKVYNEKGLQKTKALELVAELNEDQETDGNQEAAQ